MDWLKCARPRFLVLVLLILALTCRSHGCRFVAYVGRKPLAASAIMTEADNSLFAQTYRPPYTPMVKDSPRFSHSKNLARNHGINRDGFGLGFFSVDASGQAGFGVAEAFRSSLAASLDLEECVRECADVPLLSSEEASSWGESNFTLLSADQCPVPGLYQRLSSLFPSSLASNIYGVCSGELSHIFTDHTLFFDDEQIELYGTRDGPAPSSPPPPAPRALLSDLSGSDDSSPELMEAQQRERERMANEKWMCWNNDFVRLSASVHSHLLFGHIRAATFGKNEIENSHPFVFGNLLWMHNGGIAHFNRIQPKIEQRLSRQAKHLISGTTDSEHAAALFLDILHDAGEDEVREWRSRRPERTKALVQRRQHEGVQVASSLLYSSFADVEKCEPNEVWMPSFPESPKTQITCKNGDVAENGKCDRPNGEHEPTSKSRRQDSMQRLLGTGSMPEHAAEKVRVIRTPLGYMERGSSSRPVYYRTSDLRYAMMETIRELDELFEEVSDELYGEIIQESNEGAGVRMTRAEFQETLGYSSMNFAVSDGRTFIASRYRNSIEEDPPTLYYSVSGGGILKSEQEDGVQNVFVTSEPLVRGEEAEKEYEMLSKDEIITIYPDEDDLNTAACMEVGKADGLRVEFSCLSTACEEDQERRRQRAEEEEREEMEKREQVKGNRKLRFWRLHAANSDDVEKTGRIEGNKIEKIGKKQKSIQSRFLQPERHWDEKKKREKRKENEALHAMVPSATASASNSGDGGANTSLSIASSLSDAAMPYLIILAFVVSWIFAQKKK
mmetsp:Transcript_12821/g.33905  ORF Transcript_12821/g.33905 Transcript_12821/m.33905 type:complete len:786 (-) Transcript_12821:279-2636(-)